MIEILEIARYFSKCKILPSADTSAHGLGGYIKAAFLIWSAISSSSLNGNVPLRLFENDLKIISPLQLLVEMIRHELRAQILAKFIIKCVKVIASFFQLNLPKGSLRTVRPRISETK